MNRRFQKERKKSMKIRTHAKAGGMTMQHNQTLACGLKIKSGVTAGEGAPPTIRGRGK
jgi:hypothetical protein